MKLINKTSIFLILLSLSSFFRLNCIESGHISAQNPIVVDLKNKLRKCVHFLKKNRKPIERGTIATIFLTSFILYLKANDWKLDFKEVGKSIAGGFATGFLKKIGRKIPVLGLAILFIQGEGFARLLNSGARTIGTDAADHTLNYMGNL